MIFKEVIEFMKKLRRLLLSSLIFSHTVVMGSGELGEELPVSGAKTAAHLMDEQTIWEIFTYLPFPEIARNKSLSKEWNRKIKTAMGVLNHLSLLGDINADLKSSNFSRLFDYAPEKIAQIFSHQHSWDRLSNLLNCPKHTVENKQRLRYIFLGPVISNHTAIIGSGEIEEALPVSTIATGIAAPVTTIKDMSDDLMLNIFTYSRLPDIFGINRFNKSWYKHWNQKLTQATNHLNHWSLVENISWNEKLRKAQEHLSLLFVADDINAHLDLPYFTFPLSCAPKKVEQILSHPNALDMVRSMLKEPRHVLQDKRLFIKLIAMDERFRAQDRVEFAEILAKLGDKGKSQAGKAYLSIYETARTIDEKKLARAGLLKMGGDFNHEIIETYLSIFETAQEESMRNLARESLIKLGVHL